LIEAPSIHHDEFIEAERGGVRECGHNCPFFVQRGDDDGNRHRHDMLVGYGKTMLVR
jgi:hypothetical protein